MELINKLKHHQLFNYVFIIIFFFNVNVNQVAFSYEFNGEDDNCKSINGWMSNANETCDDLKEYGFCNTTDFSYIHGYTESTACCHCDKGGLDENKIIVQESNSPEVTCFDDTEWKIEGKTPLYVDEELNANTTTEYLFTCDYFKNTPEVSCKRFGSYIDTYRSGLSGNEACCR